MESLIGRGGMGVVYRATDLSLERPVALKLVAPELAEDKRFRERFLREPRLAASLDHPNVIPIYEAGERDGQLYLAMRYVDGSDLKTVLARDGKLAPERALRILAQVAAALDAANRRALVHRDVKPANVLLDENEHAYLTDFGITKQLGGDSTDTGRVVGTLDYLAPEQIRGDPVDGRTDCYSLACVLYQCLSGTPPFHRETEAETMWAHMQEQPAPLRAHPKLAPVLRKALAKDRDERYGSCAELIDAASEALGLATPPRPVFASPALVRRRHAIFAFGLLLLAASITAGVLALTGGDGESEPLANGVAALDPASGAIASLTKSGERAGQRRRRSRRRLGAQRRGRERLAHRPGEQGDRQDVQARRRPERDRGRRGSGLGRERRRGGRAQHHGQRVPDRPPLGARHAHREARRGGQRGHAPDGGAPAARRWRAARYGRSTRTAACPASTPRPAGWSRR